MSELFVFIMSVGRENENNNLCIKNAIDKPVLVGDTSAPSSFGVSFQRFWMSCACGGVFVKFAYQLQRFLISVRLVLLKFLKTVLSIFFDVYKIAFHRLRIYLSSSSRYQIA